MGQFVLLEQATWTDPAFVALDPLARLLFLWSWSNPRAAICGLYVAPQRELTKAIGERFSNRTITAVEQLERKPLIRYDPKAEVLWVVNRAKYANRSPAVAVAMRREYERVPPSPVKTAFASKYRGLLASAD